MIFPIPKVKYNILKAIYRKPNLIISELIRETHSSQKAAYNYINAFLNAEIIKEEIIGKKPLLRSLKPNFTAETGKICFALLEAESNLEFFSRHPKLKGPFSQFSKESKNIIDTAVIFGSFARETESKQSDIDILVICDKSNKRKVEGIVERCFVTLQNRPSVRIINKESFIQLASKNDEFILQILKEHIVLVNFSKWIEIISS